jgi:hypothetical protein
MNLPLQPQGLPLVVYHPDGSEPLIADQELCVDVPPPEEVRKKMIWP